MTTPVSVVGVYRRFPKELFRLNNGPQIRLREYKLRRGGSFDVLADASAPNGALMRPNSRAMHSITKRFVSPQTIVYSVPRGTSLPDDLILVHERRDHYSLQPAKEMSVNDLGHAITAFLKTRATQLTKEEWLATYPTPSDEF